MDSEERGMYWLDHVAEPGTGRQAAGGVLVNVHAPSACAGRHCCLHNPSDHPLREAPLNWRDDRGVMERICEHGIGHDDPDDLAFRRASGHPDTGGVHGCDGCCRRRS